MKYIEVSLIDGEKKYEPKVFEVTHKPESDFFIVTVAIDYFQKFHGSEFSLNTHYMVKEVEKPEVFISYRF